tara:strand:+ start:1740 stop:1853 length:114 start_codon:yes stop_codon:yes gene_type:complete
MGGAHHIELPNALANARVLSRRGVIGLRALEAPDRDH